MAQVCPNCEKNLLPKLHPKLHDNYVCIHVIQTMSGAELREMFPNAEQVIKEIFQFTYKKKLEQNQSALEEPSNQMIMKPFDITGTRRRHRPVTKQSRRRRNDE